MTNPIKGQVPITLGGRALILNFSVESVVLLEVRLGQTFRQIGQRIVDDDSVAFLRTWFWAALLEHQSASPGVPEFSEKAAGELMREDGGSELSLKLFEAWRLSWPVGKPTAQPEAAEGDADPRRRAETPATAGTGKSSSGSGLSTRSRRRKPSGA